MSFGVIRLTSVALLVLTLMARPSRPNQEGEASPPPSPKIVARKGSMQTIGLTLLLISMPIYVLAMLSSTTETSSILPTNFIPDDNIAHDDIAPGASAQLLYWASDQFTLTTLVASTALYVDGWKCNVVCLGLAMCYMVQMAFVQVRLQEGAQVETVGGDDGAGARAMVNYLLGCSMGLVVLAVVPSTSSSSTTSAVLSPLAGFAEGATLGAAGTSGSSGGSRRRDKRGKRD